MQAARLITLLFLVAGSVFGQTSSGPIAMEEEAFNACFLSRTVPTVKGRVINLSKPALSKTQIGYTLVTPLQKLQVTKTCSLMPDGSFTLTLDYAFPYQQIWINLDSLFYTAVYASSDLFIELDAAVLKRRNEAEYNGPGVRYLGTDGALNDYATNHILFKRDEQLNLDEKVQTTLWNGKAGYASFLKTYDSLYGIFNGLDDEYIKANTSSFSWVVKNERESGYFAGLCFKHWNRQMPEALFEKVKAHKAYLTSNDGMVFYQYLLTYLRNVALNQVNAGDGPYDLTAIMRRTTGLLDSLFVPAKADFIKLRFSNLDAREQKQAMEAVLPTLKTEWCNRVINREYKKTVDDLAAINKILNASKPLVSNRPLGQPLGELPFGARLYRVEGIGADSLLSLLTNAFKENALFIDFWATWCAPCIAELPHSKKLSEESRDLPVEFIYLCTSASSDVEKWKAKIAEYGLRGTHLFVEKRLESDLMNRLSLSGFPSYLLINKKGACRANIPSRPSALNREKLLALLKQ